MIEKAMGINITTPTADDALIAKAAKRLAKKRERKFGRKRYALASA